MTTHLEPVAKDGEFLAVSGTGRRMWSIAVAGRPSFWIVLMIVHRSSTGCKVTVDGTRRADIHPGLRVMVVLKPDQRSGKLTEGVVKDILTKSATHSRGIKVRLETGEVGRVREIVSDDQMQEPDWSEVTRFAAPVFLGSTGADPGKAVLSNLPNQSTRDRVRGRFCHPS
jgi:uncharacterized repeat protein (TIGR03833 family)